MKKWIKCFYIFGLISGHHSRKKAVSYVHYSWEIYTMTMVTIVTIVGKYAQPPWSLWVSQEDHVCIIMVKWSLEDLDFDAL